MFKKLHQLAIAAAFITTVFAPEIGVANALPLVPLTTLVTAQTSEVVPAQYFQHQGNGPATGWQFQRDGNRCRTRFGNCRHFHNGFYYQTPWWVLPLIIGDQIHRHNGGNSHVRWCLSRYRSYNPRTDMWLGNNGRHYQCNSPY